MGKKLLLIALVGSGLTGCQPSRSEQAKLPVSPQYAKVQTPVLHQMPVPFYTRPKASRQWIKPFTTVQTLPVKSPVIAPVQIQNHATLPVIDVAVIQKPVLVIPINTAPVVESNTLEFLPMEETTITYELQKNVQPSQEPVVVIAPPTQLTFTKQTQTSPWIEPTPVQHFKNTSSKTLNQSIIDSEVLLEVPYTLELLEVDKPSQSTNPQPAQAVTPNIELLAPIPTPSKISVESAHEATLQAILPSLEVEEFSIQNTSPTLAPTSPPLPITKVLSHKVVEVKDVITKEQENNEVVNVTTVTVPKSQTFEQPGEIVMEIMTPEPVLSKPAVEEIVQPPKPKLPEVRPESYVIQKGDTLWSIATRFYGNGQRWIDIARTNRIYRPDRMSLGTTIRLP